MESEPATKAAPSRIIITAPLPFSKRISYAIRLWVFKAFVQTALAFARIFGAKRFGKGPTYTKKYSARKTITNRIFIPSSYRSGDKPLPLYIDIHGGGFVLCNPQIDDEFCGYMAEKHGICVVSIGYRLAPRFPYPIPGNDIAALTQAVLEDPDLPVDKNKIAIGGFSAGGNLALVATQMDGLRGKIPAVVGVYPVVDFTRPGKEKLKTRPITPGKRDMLADIGNLFNWAYVPKGTDNSNSFLSPIYAKRDTLPTNVFLIGCEYDMLCRESQDMAEILAESETGKKTPLKEGNGWEKGNVRWELVEGWEHGFNQTHRKGEEEVRRVKRANELHDAIAEWLFRKVYRA